MPVSGGGGAPCPCLWEYRLQSVGARRPAAVAWTQASCQAAAYTTDSTSSVSPPNKMDEAATLSLATSRSAKQLRSCAIVLEPPRSPMRFVGSAFATTLIEVMARSSGTRRRRTLSTAAQRSTVASRYRTPVRSMRSQNAPAGARRRDHMLTARAVTPGVAAPPAPRPSMARPLCAAAQPRQRGQDPTVRKADKSCGESARMHARSRAARARHVMGMHGGKMAGNVVLRHAKLPKDDHTHGRRVHGPTLRHAEATVLICSR